MTDLTGSELKGKVAIVTGAGRMRGIGRGTAVVLARMGANVVVTGTGRDPGTFPQDEKDAGWRDIHSTAEQVESYGVKALPLISNITDEDDVQKMVDTTVAEFGSLDIIVNNAAAPYGNDRVSVLDMRADVFKTVIEVKVLGTFYACRAAVAQMIKQGEGGRVVNLSSTMGKSGRANTSAYNAANFAVDGFTQALSKEVGEHAITVNSVCPGLTETSRLDPMGRTGRWDARIVEIPLLRAGSDEEVGELIGFLCSPRAGYITGQSLNINGGVITER
ncbi:MAG TPA: SDR family NAD(P)-dependent oxidoreductase [Dehalococcoidia bacterium]|jgi:NAD(P)-dependent dehydrogenase (short-subunit alcohol dehydrogenase family)|nr:short-chain dehydrogenase [Chloroflexota bacterium]MDP6056537.1 SDR family NAD(P)-dependent oxidoreductase [Dehalococcoidia bacterium]MDP7089696.1 SDR family NAD(P)-dependent oxidoreductase [Dehalococcoidia bacterium]MDP7262744.1 SDR family NAD(P)-dependent oxidoreductase [Dehalococcoidia bacterium]HJP28703.1 SDR family NAD(P)-dependent oxidoreductase [Dehalococcoidia bacterium]|tara:strand:- start:17690 stop:18517 length:828 start_codon:yes stop_codon:yes gene_type:complete